MRAGRAGPVSVETSPINQLLLFPDLVDQYGARNKARVARDKNRLHILHTTLLRADLFVLDEVGFQPPEREDATFLFEPINKRYAAQKSTIITSNKSYGQWHEICPDPVLAVALLDRLLHHSTTINIKGDSYRQRHRHHTGLPTPHNPEEAP